MPPLLSLVAVSKRYAMGTLTVSALEHVDLEVEEGELLAIVGPSGSGKTTLMNILGFLDRPTEGEYRFDGVQVNRLSDDQLAVLRGRAVGFVFQNYSLLPRTSALDNVAAPLLYQGVPTRERRARAQTALERVGLGERLAHEPTELSGGQQQRVAIARALVTDPRIVLADEPTGNLDTHSGEEVSRLLTELNRAGRTIILITHDPEVAALATRQIHILDGRIREAAVAA